MLPYLKRVLFLILLFTIPAFADYAPPDTWELLGASNLIVEGTIVHVGSEKIRVEISQVVAGEHSSDSIKIEKFEDWTCGRRWTQYQKGQSAIFCLREQEGLFGNTYSVIGGGNEGEMPTSGGSVYYWNHYVGQDEGIPGLERDLHVVHGEPIRCRKMDKKKLVRSIREFRKCFEIRLDPKKPWFRRDYYQINQTCDDKSLNEFMAADPFHEFLVESMEEALARMK